MEKMKIYLKTDNIQAAKNTALSAHAVGECEIILDSTKKVKSDLWELGEAEETTLEAGDLVLKSWTKKPKIYEGKDQDKSLTEIRKKYHVLRLTDNSKPKWWDYYNRMAKKIGGYSTQWM